MHAIIHLLTMSLAIASPVDKPAVPDKDKFVRLSVFEGLKEDGVPLKLAAELAENPDFVPKCLLCDQTRRAFSDYSKLDKTPAPTAGRGLSKELARGLASTDTEVRRAAMRDLISGYMDRGYSRYELTADQKQEMIRTVKSMEYIPKSGAFPDGLKFCPSCDGACRRKPKSIN